MDGGQEITGTETVAWAFEGKDLEIELCPDHATQLRQRLAEFIEHARKVGATARTKSRPASARRQAETIRAWAKQQGIPISERGRIPATVISQYEAAN